jgi:2-C-methyl-D-erythritol 4-phosphate cytidylyltransferase
VAARGEVWTIIVAAGRGDRFGSPKQFEQLLGVPVVNRSTRVAAAVSDGVVVVLPPNEDREIPGATVTVPGGTSRSESVRAGLAAVPATAEVIVVHDAARPLASEGLYRATIDAVRRGADGAVPVVDVVDTLRERAGGPVDRDLFVAVQTPQAFAAAPLRAAHAAGGTATDDASLVEGAGGRIVTVPGERTNLKITERSDLVVAAALLGDDR